MGAFNGNPQAKITAINVSGGLTLSRVSGTVPAQVHVSIKDITVTGTIIDNNGSTVVGADPIPFNDLEVLFDFGDPTGTETFVNPTNGLTVNANWQPGPSAAYLYQNAGSYTITAKLRAKNGNIYSTAEVTTSFTASAFSGTEVYFDSSVAGPGTGTEIDPYKNLSSMLNLWTDNMRWNLKAGSEWRNSADAGNRISFRKAIFGSISGCRVRKWGSGADPKIIGDANPANSTAGPLYSGTGSSGGSGSYLKDIVISKVQFITEASVSNSSSSCPIKILGEGNTGGDGTMENITLDGVTAISYSTATIGAMQLGQNAVHTFASGKVLLWGCDFRSPIGTVGTNRITVYLQSWTNYVAMIGCYVDGGGGGGNLDHHIYPIVKEDTVWRWNEFGPSSLTSTPTHNYCINMDWNPQFYGWGSSCSVSGSVLTVGGTISGSFKVDMALNDQSTGLDLGVTISSFGTGTGGAGTYNLSGSPGNFTGHAVNGNTGTPDVSRRHVFCSNYGFGTQNFHDAGDAVNEPRNAQFREFVAQFNKIDGLTGGGFSPSGAIVTYTIRHNHAVNTTASTNAIVSPAVFTYIVNEFRLALYGNEFDAAGGMAVDLSKGTLTHPNALTIVDNKFYNRGATTGCVNVHFSDSDVSVIDRNTYYMPSGPGSGLNFNQNNGSAVSWSAWQAQGLDPNGFNAAVSWAQGEFGVPAGRVKLGMRAG